MMSLFSTFDLEFYRFSMVVFMIVFVNFWMKVFKMSSIFIAILKVEAFMMKFFESIKMGATKHTMSWAMSLMTGVLFLNFYSVLGFNCALTSQMSTVLMLGSSVWSSFMMFKLLCNLKSFVLHCIPEGCPMLLTTLLFLIELVSNLIRPLTISVRLVANILAGHLLMILLSEMALKSSFVTMPYLLLNVVEMFVAMIQSYIFVTMVWLYYSEI